MKIKFEWEALDGHTLRARVPGGWLVRYHSHAGGVAMTMVHDPEHAWQAEVSEALLAKYRERLARLEREVQDPYQEGAVKAEMEEEIENLRTFIEQHA